MKLIIAGSRTLNVTDLFISELTDQFDISYENLTIVSGRAKGIDLCGEEFARIMEFNIQFFNADWSKHGNAAGPIRNKEMAEYADALLLIWDGKSKGSANMKKEMIKLNKPIYEVIMRKYN